jgi:twitching motility protein PilT
MATILIDKLLQTQVNRDASDLHISVGQPPVLRIDGRLVRLDTKTLEPDDTVALMKSISPERCQQELQEVGGSDFGFAFGDQARFRVSIFKQKGHVGMVLRLIPIHMMTFEDLGTPPVLKELIMRPRGLILVTGPTGSGKTTTLASAIDYLNQTVDRHIITIEDPIEFYHTHKKSTINQRECGIDVPSFAEAIRRALRQDPDVILVGEMRDLETISAAITAAETGHLVLSTLHTQNAHQTIERIIDVYPPAQQNQIRAMLSNTLQAVASMTLMKRHDVPGMVPACEIMVCNAAVRNCIRENRIHEIPNIIETNRARGMCTLDDSIKTLYLNGVISWEDAIAKAARPEALHRALSA